MSTIALPAGFCPNQFSMRLATVQRSFASPFRGSEQVVDLLNDRWVVSLSLPNRRHADAARLEAFVASMRGMTNTVKLYHFVRSTPRGTMRGAPITDNFRQGDDWVRVLTTVGATLLAGDMLGIAGMLLQVREDCVAAAGGLITIPVVNRLRKSLPYGTAVEWDKPTAAFRLMSQSSVQYVPGYAEGVSLDFAEVVA